METEYSFDLSKYEIIQKIGKGAFGAVYKVKEIKTGVIFAAKISLLEFEEKEEIEAPKALLRNLIREINFKTLSSCNYEKYKIESLRLYDKGNYYKVNIVQNEMAYDQKNYVIELTRKSLNMHKNHFECAKYVKNQLDSKYGRQWAAILSARNYCGSYMSYCDNCYIIFTIGELNVIVFKSSAYL